jgi:preprotein translocase subunit SecA
LCDWFKTKFDIALDSKLLAEKSRDELKEIMHTAVMKLYREKEVEFPVMVAMARFMSERHQPGTMGQRYDREGLYRWAQQRFYTTPRDGVPVLSEEEFRTQSRSKIQEMLLDVSRKYYPKSAHEEIDAKLAESFRGTQYSEEEDARELAEWARSELGLDVSVEQLTGVSEDTARDILWTAFDKLFRPEMRRMERSLLLNHLDVAWKNHLYSMDHLRQGIGLMGYAQVDPKTEYKRQGMKEFESMWEGVQDKVSDTIFRVEDDESFQESVWAISATIKEAAPTPMSQEQQEAIAASQKSDRKPEPIRNRKDRVGRNDPCPCGSGKKYKNCCMRLMAG